jgi:hypothetical protein
MDVILNFLRSDIFLVILFVFLIILLVLYSKTTIHLKKLRESYSKFMNKLGNGNDLEQMIRNYIDKVEKTDERNEEIINYCKKIDNDIKGCTQKIGIVRYNAFKDTGSDLSFTLALLDKYNNGVVLNGIYARDSSNIYAKPVKNGESNYVLSNEEKEAIRIAVESK